MYIGMLALVGVLFTLILFAFSLHWLQTVLWYKCRFSPFVTHIHSTVLTAVSLTLESPRQLSGLRFQTYSLATLDSDTMN